MSKMEAKRKLNGGDRKQAKILQSATAKSQGQQVFSKWETHLREAFAANKLTTEDNSI